LNKIEHSGGGFGSDSEMIRFLDQRLTIAVLCNVRDEDAKDHPLTAVPLARKMLDIYLEGPVGGSSPNQTSGGSEAKPSGAGPVAPAVLQSFEGLYWNGRFDRVYRFAAKDGQLIMTSLPDGRATKMEVVGDHQLRAGPVALTFNAGYAEMEISQPGASHRRLVRVAEPLASAADVQQFAGDFYSAAVDAIWHLHATGDKLSLELKNFPAENLRPAFRDAFFTDRGLLHFTRDSGGFVNGFEMGNARVWKVAFRRVQLPAPQVIRHSSGGHRSGAGGTAG
jgi:hypothetical protein